MKNLENASENLGKAVGNGVNAAIDVLALGAGNKANTALSFAKSGVSGVIGDNNKPDYVPDNIDMRTTAMDRLNLRSIAVQQNQYYRLNTGGRNE